MAQLANQTVDDTEDDAERSSRSRPAVDRVTLLVAGLTLVMVAAGGGWFTAQALAQRPPSDDSVDAGFARDMRTHHAQAVEMAATARDRIPSGPVRTVANEIIYTQQAQLGVMAGWLDIWGLPMNDSGPAMAWMGTPVEGRMPGMASRDELDELGQMEGEDAEVRFLQMMIRHHEGGAAMSEAAATGATSEPVRTLAANIASSQGYEAEYMRTLLADRGGEPLPSPAHPAGRMGSHEAGDG